MAKENGKAKYFILMEQLKQQILSGNLEAGDRLPSENELAKKYEISRHTVRKALSILENDGYIVAEHGRGTFVSERMRKRGGTQNIAVVMTYLSDYIFPCLIQGIDRVMTDNGYSIILKNTGNSRKREASVLEEILTKQVDGVIIEPSKSAIYCRNMGQYQMLEELRIPCVFIQGTYPQMERKAHILLDDFKGGYEITEYLLSLGHTRIGGIFKADDSQGGQRHKGYIRALQDRGIIYDPDFVVWFHTEDRELKPKEIVRDLVKEKELSALVCYNDQIAAEVIQSMKKFGMRVPEDISITGYDDSYLAENIGLTTMAHPKEKLGEMAAELLLEKIHGIPDEDSKVNRLLEPELVVRTSCRAKIPVSTGEK